jgi:hypothetical protein
MPTTVPSKSHKLQNSLAATQGVPAGFEHCWDKMTAEFKVFVLDELAHGKKFVAGKATTKEQLESLLSTPPKLRAALMDTPGFAIYQPENFSWFEAIYAAFYGPRTPANSQLAAQFKVVGNRLEIDLEKHIGQMVAGLFNLKKHYETGMPVRPETKRDYDTDLGLRAGMGILRETIPPLFAERVHLAKVERDGQFTRRSNDAFNKCPETPPKDLLAHLGVSQLRQALLRWWCDIPGYEPHFGLADFTCKAVGQYCGVVFVSPGKRKDAPFDEDKVREAVRSLRLMRRDWIVTGISMTRSQAMLTLKGGQTVPFRRV